MPRTRLVSRQINTRRRAGELEPKNYKETIAPDSANIDLITLSVVFSGPMGLLDSTSSTQHQGEWTVQAAIRTWRRRPERHHRASGVVGGVQMDRVLTFSPAAPMRSRKRCSRSPTSPCAGPGAFGLFRDQRPAQRRDDKYNMTKIAYMTAGSLTEEDSQKDLQLGVESPAPAQWGGIESNYFLLAMVPTSSGHVRPRQARTMSTA